MVWNLIDLFYHAKKRVSELFLKAVRILLGSEVLLIACFWLLRVLIYLFDLNLMCLLGTKDFRGLSCKTLTETDSTAATIVQKIAHRNQDKQESKHKHQKTPLAWDHESACLVSLGRIFPFFMT